MTHPNRPDPRGLDMESTVVTRTDALTATGQELPRPVLPALGVGHEGADDRTTLRSRVLPKATELVMKPGRKFRSEEPTTCL